MSNKLHCPRCGKSFQVETSANERQNYFDNSSRILSGFHGDNQNEFQNLTEFICSTCHFEFKMKYDVRRKVYVPVTELSFESIPESPRAADQGVDGKQIVSLNANQAVVQSENRTLNQSTTRTRFQLTNLTLNQSATRIMPQIPNQKLTQASNNLTANLTAQIDEKNKEYLDPVGLRLKQQWQEVLEDFNNSETHSHFIDLCHRLGRIKFAEERYQYLKKALGDDPEVNKRIHQIEMRSLQTQSVNDRILFESKVIPYWRRYGTLFIVAILLTLTGTLLRSLEWISFLGIFIIAWLLFYGIKK